MASKASSRETARKVGKSSGFTPKSKLVSAREVMSAATTPTAIPMATSLAPSLCHQTQNICPLCSERHTSADFLAPLHHETRSVNFTISLQ
jgi:hypothetical protein